MGKNRGPNPYFQENHSFSIPVHALQVDNSDKDWHVILDLVLNKADKQNDIWPK